MAVLILRNPTLMMNEISDSRVQKRDPESLLVFLRVLETGKEGTGQEMDSKITFKVGFSYR